MIHILVVDDEYPIANLIRETLENVGYRCTCAYDGDSAATEVEKGGYDLVILDVMLPKIGGFELIEYIRQYHIPVISLTAKTDVNDRIKGLRLGAEDYIIKPFDVMELVARIEVVLRRFNKSEEALRVLDLTINTASRSVLKDGAEVELTYKEFELLLLLIKNKNIALYRESHISIQNFIFFYGGFYCLFHVCICFSSASFLPSEEIADQNYREYFLASVLQRPTDEKTPFIGEYGDWKKQIALEDFDRPAEGRIAAGVVNNGENQIQATSRHGADYIINYYDITDILEQRDANYQIYRRVIILSAMFVAVVLYLFSLYITRPLVKVTKIAEAVSEGNYSMRVKTDHRRMKSYEVTKLGKTLNELSANTKKHIEELEDMVKKREEFIGNFTHEIKTPLTSIIGYADLLRIYDLKADKKREYADFIYHEGKRLEQLSLNLLQLIVLGKTDFERKAVTAEELFKKWNEEVRFLAKKYGVRIRLSYEAAMISAEPSLFTAAVLNLADNACKASEKGRSIVVQGRKKGEDYTILVIDNGRGIPEEEIEKITEPFYMADKSRARSQGGAGLGLALCRRIVELHGGELDIQSMPGKGTRVTITVRMESGGTENEEEME